jgi:hypothetical protein
MRRNRAPCSRLQIERKEEAVLARQRPELPRQNPYKPRNNKSEMAKQIHAMSSKECTAFYYEAFGPEPKQDDHASDSDSDDEHFQ